MNKRLKKKMTKRTQTQETPKIQIPVGYGVITGNDNGGGKYIKHFYKVGTLVKILGFEGMIHRYANCMDGRGFEQAVSLQHIKMNLAEGK